MRASAVDGRMGRGGGRRPRSRGPEEFRRHLFERWSRDTATAERVMGTGLGLFISRELAHANGGDLVHREASPAGSEFVLRLRRP